jgi:hypothetical protein
LTYPTGPFVFSSSGRQLAEQLVADEDLAALYVPELAPPAVNCVLYHIVVYSYHPIFVIFPVFVWIDIFNYFK